MPKPAKHPAYVKWLHDQPCCVTGALPVEFHHLTRLVPMSRMTKSDRYGVPLTAELHRGDVGVHQLGVTEFEKRYGVDLTALAEFYWNKWESEDET